MGLTEEVKVANICKVQELLLNKEPHLLGHYLDDILQFSVDRSAEVRKTVTGFIEEAGLLSTIIFLLCNLVREVNIQYFS